MVIVALAKECGLKEGGNIFDFVKFDKDLSKSRLASLLGRG